MAKNAEVDRLLDELIKNCDSPDDLLGEKGLLKQLTAGLVERMLESEMSDHLGYEKHDPRGKNSGNSRNGKTPKTLKTDRGEIPIEVPRDRNGEFEPQIVKKRQRRFAGFDDTIISLYSRGMTTRAIQEHLKELYGVDVSPSLLSSVTDDVLDEVRAWQSHLLKICPLLNVFPDLSTVRGQELPSILRLDQIPVCGFDFNDSYIVTGQVNEDVHPAFATMTPRRNKVAPPTRYESKSWNRCLARSRR